MIVPFYAAAIRLYLEYCAQFWSPQYKEVEKVWRRETKIIMGLDAISL